LGRSPQSDFCLDEYQKRRLKPVAWLLLDGDTQMRFYFDIRDKLAIRDEVGRDLTTASEAVRGPCVQIAFPPRIPIDRDQKEGRFRMHNIYRSRGDTGGHVKDVHNAEIRIEATADQFDRSARVEALRWRATRSVAPYAGRNRPGRTLRVVSRPILTFRVIGK